jgi:hypothetical protein
MPSMKYNQSIKSFLYRSSPPFFCVNLFSKIILCVIFPNLKTSFLISRYSESNNDQYRLIYSDPLFVILTLTVFDVLILLVHVRFPRILIYTNEHIYCKYFDLRSLYNIRLVILILVLLC